MVIPRRVAFLGLAALILAGAGIAAAATHEDDDGTPAAIEQPVTTTTSSLLPETTTTVALTTTTTTPATSTTVGRTTTTRQGATTTTRPGATTTTAPAGAVTACKTPQMLATVSTDKSTYAIGEAVKIQSKLQNRSSATCSYPSLVFVATILGPSGQRVTGFERVNESPGEIGAGQVNEATVEWTRVACTSDICPPNTPGAYTVSATWNFPGGPYTATTTINLT